MSAITRQAVRDAYARRGPWSGAQQLSKEQLVTLASKFGGWRGSDLVYAVAKMLSESGGHVKVVGTNDDGSIDRGVWQLNSKAWPQVDDTAAFHPIVATIVARAIWNEHGWRPWRSSDKRTTARLPEARAAVAKAGLQTEMSTAGGPGLLGPALALIGGLLILGADDNG